MKSKFTSTTLLTLFFFLFLSSMIFSQDTKKSILFVYGGWEGHEPEQCKDLFVPWLEEQGYKVTVSPSTESYLDTDLMNSIDLVIYSNLKTLKYQQRKRFLRLYQRAKRKAEKQMPSMKQQNGHCLMIIEP